jgi:hypothetical protein
MSIRRWPLRLGTAMTIGLFPRRDSVVPKAEDSAKCLSSRSRSFPDSRPKCHRPSSGWYSLTRHSQARAFGPRRLPFHASRCVQVAWSVRVCTVGYQHIVVPYRDLIMGSMSEIFCERQRFWGLFFEPSSRPQFQAIANCCQQRFVFDRLLEKSNRS